MMLHKNMILVSMSCIFLASCSTTNNHVSSLQGQKQIKTVYINPDIQKPNNIYGAETRTKLKSFYQGMTTGFVTNTTANTADTLAKNNEIDIRNIVYQKWNTQLATNPSIKLTHLSSTDTVLITSIDTYGVGIPLGLSNKYMPVLALNARLIKNNRVIWQMSERIYPLTKGMPNYSMDDIRRDPTKLYAMWDKASEKLVQNMAAVIAQ